VIRHRTGRGEGRLRRATTGGGGVCAIKYGTGVYAYSSNKKNSIELGLSGEKKITRVRNS